MKEYKFHINGNEYNVVINSVEGNNAYVTVNGKDYTVGLEESSAVPAFSPAQTSAVPAQTSAVPTAPVPAPAAAAPATGNGKAVTSPLPGVIISINVKVGDQVKEGQEVAVLEAMKMENSIEAGHSGTVTAVHVSKGDSVPEGAPVVTIG